MSTAEERLVVQEDLVRFGLAQYAAMDDLRDEVAEVSDDDVATALDSGVLTQIALDDASGALLANPGSMRTQTQTIADARAVVQIAAQKGAVGGVPTIDAGGRVLDGTGKQLMQRDSVFYLSTDYGIATAAVVGAPISQGAAISTLTALVSAAGGGTILFAPGVYEVSSMALGDNVRYLSQYKNAAVFRKVSTTGQLLVNAIGRVGAVISGFTLDIGAAKLYPDSLPTAGTTWTNSIRLTDCKDCNIDDNTILNGATAVTLLNQSGGANGILGCQNISVSRNRFQGTTRDFAIYVSPKITGGNKAKRIFTDGNVIDFLAKKNTVTISTWVAIYSSDVTEHFCRWNIVDYSDDTGYMVNNAIRFEISGNVALTKQVSIYCGASLRGRIIGNHLESSGDIGISIHARDDVSEPPEGTITVSSNVVYSCGRNGIAVEGTYQVVIVGNVIESFGLLSDTTVTATATAGQILSSVTSHTITNTGSVDLYWGTTSAVTVGTGTLLAAGASITRGGTTWAVTASGTTTVRRVITDRYASGIEVHGIDSRTPKNITIVGNTVLRGSSTTYPNLIGIQVLDSPSGIVVIGNGVDSTMVIGRQFVYGSLNGDYDVQGGSNQRLSNRQLVVPLYSAMKTTTPNAGAICRGSTTGKFYLGDGTNWRPITIGAAETPT